MKGNIETKMDVLLPLLTGIIDSVAEKVAERLTNSEETKAYEPRYYSRQEVADILHVTLPTLHAMTKRGDIIAKKCGSRVLYDAAEIDKAVSEKRVYRYKHSM